MTAREYAKKNGIEIVGKLTKTSVTREKWDYAKEKMVTVKITFYVDEAGNEIHGNKNEGYTIITADGGVC